MVGLTLSPSRRPLMPPVFEAAWYDLEGDQTKNWRWSSGDADVVVASAQPKSAFVRLTFRLGSVQPRQVDIYLDAKKVYSVQVTASDETASIDLALTLPPGPNTLHFRTDQTPASANGADPRKLAFRLIDFKIAN
jgi:hypothetical protein